MAGKPLPGPPLALQKPPLAQLRSAFRRKASLHLPLAASSVRWPCEVEIFHVALFAIGLVGGGGRVPGWALAIGLVGLVLAVLPRLDVQALWRRERRFVDVCSREMVLATLAIYVDSVAVYMVAVVNEHRLENIQLQDNVRLLLVALCGACPSFEVAFLRLPELYAEEALVYALVLGLLAVARSAPGFSFLACLARCARALRWCRLLRVACFASTVMPSQTRNCFVNRYDETYSVAEHWREALSHWRMGGGCNDLIFSGHLVILSLCALLYSGHSCLVGVEGRWLPLVIWCRVAHGGLRIIHGRFHMSVDVVVAVVVTCLIWHTLPRPEREGVAREGADGLDSDEEREGPPDLDELGVAGLLSFVRPWPAKVRGWPAALLFTAVTGFGLLAASPSQAGPLSDYNRQRVRLIEVASPSAEGAGTGLASSAEPPRRPRLLCAMLHIEQGDGVRRDYAHAVAETWGWHCDGLLLWDERRADIAPLDLEAAREEPATDSPPSDRWFRVRRMWRYIGRHALPRYDYFAAVDDGGFIVPENLLKVVTEVEGSRKREAPLFLVDSGPWAPWGYVLNAAAVRELLEAMDGNIAKGAPGGAEACPVPSRASASDHPAEYEIVANCLHRARGLAAFNWDSDPSVRTALGCRKGDRSTVNLKSREELGKQCRHTVLAYMVPQPGWVHEIFMEVYGGGGAAAAAGRRRGGRTAGLGGPERSA